MGVNNLGFKTVLISGIFNFIGDKESGFTGPIKKGFRPIIWYDSIDRATSCSFVTDKTILKGDSAVIDIVILNELAIGKKIEKGIILNIGSSKHKIGEFMVKEHLGLWQNGKVP